MPSNKISIKNFMIGILTPPDPIYGDDSYVSRCLETISKKYDKIYKTISENIPQDILHKHTKKTSHFNNYTTNQFTFLLSMIHFGLSIHSKTTQLNDIPNKAFIINNASKIYIDKRELKEFLRQEKQPLPYFIFPNENDNTTLQREHLDRVFDTVFYGQNFDKEISEYESMTPKTIEEKFIKTQELARLKKGKKLRDRLLTPNNRATTLELLYDIDDGTLSLLLESLISNRQGIAFELKSRGFPLEKIGRLLRQKGDIDSSEANIKRAQRLLDERKN